MNQNSDLSDDSHESEQSVSVPTASSTAQYSDSDAQPRSTAPLTSTASASTSYAADPARHCRCPRCENKRKTREKEQKKKFHCSISNCGKSFAHQFSLVRHLVSHSAERPYKCEFCNTTYKRKSTLQRHVRLHHEEVNL